GELEGCAAVDGGIEFLAFRAPIGEPAGVVHDTRLTAFGTRAGTNGGVDEFQAGLSRHGFSFRLCGSRTGSGESCGGDHDAAGHWHVAAFLEGSRAGERYETMARNPTLVTVAGGAERSPDRRSARSGRPRNKIAQPQGDAHHVLGPIDVSIRWPRADE